MMKWIKDYFGYREYPNDKVMLFELWTRMSEADKQDFYYLLKSIMDAKKKTLEEELKKLK
jgi:hypothetical protein|tara:strand:- start:140 stop:319 length:180 start_codon:yes stop_codon:yes gene_type:complete